MFWLASLCKDLQIDGVYDTLTRGFKKGAMAAVNRCPADVKRVPEGEYLKLTRISTYGRTGMLVLT